MHGCPCVRVCVCVCVCPCVCHHGGSRARLDGNDKLQHFALACEHATTDAVAGGVMSKDLAVCIKGADAVEPGDYVTTQDFIANVRRRLEARLVEMHRESEVSFAARTPLPSPDRDYRALEHSADEVEVYGEDDSRRDGGSGSRPPRRRWWW
eukprot:GHVU01084475.1.p1 GENE.GHVU01084475.1~~GHVU01084475.1.p1  ORF type:complete len:152 (+),score=26.12 GHVU01084475.1:10-465(+)